MKRAILFKLVLAVVFIMGKLLAFSQVIGTLTIEIKTGDKRFAGTDDPVHLLIGGKDFNLDNSSKDDFERNNTDQFKFFNADPEFSLELVKGVGKITISKTGDSFFGGGWNFASIKIWVNDQIQPIYTNEIVNKWLDGDHREWSTILGEVGWNIPEPPPFPPCTGGIIFLSTNYQNSQLDSDCDGIPDDRDPTFDPNQPDNDGDSLPNRYEEEHGLNPNSNDSDGDGWMDNQNVRDILILTKVECIDEDGYVEAGSDEIYVDAEDVRFPLSPTLDNYWEMDDGTKVEPFIVIDSRVLGKSTLAPTFKTRIKLRESDPSVFEKLYDDTFESFTLEWGRNQIKEMDFNKDNRHYKMSFKSITSNFMDPSPSNPAGDFDNDNISDSVEYYIATQDARLRPAGKNAISGYNGLSSPLKRDLFIEVDATSSDDKMPFEAKQQVASQFYYHNISMRIDDGFLGGGEILPYDEEVKFSELQGYRNMHQWPQRIRFFKYALYVPSMGGQSNGRGDLPGNKFMVSRSTMVGSFSSIVFMHELGHTMNLCHPVGTSEPPSPSPTCPIPANWQGCTNYCGVSQNDVTAMGDTIGTKEIVIGGAIGIIIGLAIIALFIPGIGWLLGGALVLGAAIIGAIGGFLFSDAYLRFVDYHPNEWPAIILHYSVTLVP